MRDRPEGELFPGAVALVVVVQVLVSLLVALAGGPSLLFGTPTPGQRVLVWIGLCLGPLSGWVAAISTGHVFNALPMLACATLLCAVSLTVAVVRRSVATLLVFALMWFLSGYLFTIAIWV